MVLKYPKQIKPMLAQDNPYKEPFKEPGYVLQEKFDGTRILAINDGKRWHMITRSWKNEVGDKFPEIMKDLGKINSNDVILDAELTFFKGGKSKFLTVLAKPATKKSYTAKLLVFDIIRYNGNITQLPLMKRLEILKKILPKSPHVKLIKTITTPTSFQKVYNDIVKKQGEGVIMKKKDSKYVFDTRKNWVKVKKIYTEDVVVVGITHGEGKRSATFGALILAQYDKNNKLTIIGKASGFDDATGLKLYNAISRMPNKDNYLQSSMPGVKKWVDPRIVVEVKYYEKTPYGVLRHPVFLRIRDDKEPKDCKIQYRR
jgi:bifunctional non-homologous end joining protein LigD